MIFNKYLILNDIIWYYFQWSYWILDINTDDITETEIIDDSDFIENDTLNTYDIIKTDTVEALNTYDITTSNSTNINETYGENLVSESKFTTISTWNGICNPTECGCNGGEWYWDYYHSKTIYIRNNSQVVIRHNKTVYLEKNKRYRIGIAATSHAYSPNPSGNTLVFTIGNFTLTHNSIVGNLKYYFFNWDQATGNYGFEFYCNYATENIPNYWYLVSQIVIQEVIE